MTCHGEDARSGVLEREVLVVELVAAVDRLASGAIALGEVAALEHEAGDHAVEDASSEVQRLALASRSLLAGAQSAEVVGLKRLMIDLL